TAAGVSVAGQIGTDGVVLGAPNLGWAGAPVGATLRAALDLPVVVANDVRAAAWAEWSHGAGRGCDDVVVVFVGTGVGGSAVVDGRMLDGAGGIAGEFGHMTLVAGGRRCHCRNIGCFEAYASGWALEERAAEAVRADERAGAGLLRLAGGRHTAITGELLATARAAGDALAVRLVEETGAFLGAGLVSLVNAFNPARVILGGGVVEGFPELLPLAAAAVRDRALPAAAAVVEVVPAELGTHAPVVGAAALAARRLREGRMTRGAATVREARPA
ncbi:MAG TPA: ROK family protein, partial [Gemmatimonadaceae bacterium]